MSESFLDNAFHEAMEQYRKTRKVDLDINLNSKDRKLLLEQLSKEKVRCGILIQGKLQNLFTINRVKEIG